MKRVVRKRFHEMFHMNRFTWTHVSNKTFNAIKLTRFRQCRDLVKESKSADKNLKHRKKWRTENRAFGRAAYGTI